MTMKTLVDTLEYNLTKEGYQVISDGAEALKLARTAKPDLILLDIMLPNISGRDVCRILCKESTVPIIMLTAKSEETDKVVSLELGADDYITKPFSMRELLARIAAMLRRVRSAKQQLATTEDANSVVTKVGNLEIDVARHEVSRNGKPVKLSPKEFALLAFLVKNKGQVFNREQIVERVWGYDYAGDARTVDVHIVSLRRKIEANPTSPKNLITVWGFGYKFEG
jgi:DNA-binding response OmpR family regulator